MAVTRRLVPCAVAGMLLLVLMVLAAPASAATVVLIRTPHPSAMASEATVRLRGELGAEGFNVKVVDSPGAADPHTFMEEQAAGPDVVAVVAIFADNPTEAVELSVIDRVTGKTVTRRVPADPAATRSAEVLSIRAHELLRASFLEIELGASRAEPPERAAAAPAAAGGEAHGRGRARQPLAAELGPSRSGACVFGSFEGIGPAVAPVLRGEHSWRELIIGRVTLAGLGTRPRIDSASASANVAQAFGLAEIGDQAARASDRATVLLAGRRRAARDDGSATAAPRAGRQRRALDADRRRGRRAARGRCAADSSWPPSFTRRWRATIRRSSSSATRSRARGARP